MKVKNRLLNFGDNVIFQDDEAFLFSLDSVILANFVSIRLTDKNIVDLCSGNAPIPMLLSFRTKANILGVELQKCIYDLGYESIISNKMDKQISFVNCDIKDLLDVGYEGKYDVVTCNPPYFKYKEGSLINQNENKMIARHEVCTNLEEVIKDGFEGTQEILNSIQGDIKAIVGTESDNIKQYLESELNYKSLTEVSNTLNKFLNTYNENDSKIDTYPELLRFLDGYSDKDKLVSVLDNLSSNILGTPVPTEEFRTLRAIEDFVRTFKSSLESRADNIQRELDNTQIGIGLNSDGSYSPDKETFYLKNATSIMNALKTLDSLINEAINNCNLEGVKTETADTRIYKLRDKTEVETNVLVSRESGNTIQIKGDGLYSGIRTTYDNGVLTIYANDNIIGQHVLGLSYIGIDSAYYDPSTESLVFKFIKEDL